MSAEPDTLTGQSPTGVRAGRPSLALAQCTVLFFGVAVGSLVARQLVCAWAAGAVGIPTTLYHYFTTAEAFPADRFQYVVVNGAAPGVSIALALIGLVLFDRTRSAGLKLYASYLSAAGAIGLLSDALGVLLRGDWIALAVTSGVPAIVVQIGAAALAVILVVLIWMSSAPLQPPARAIVLPWIATLALLPVAYAPLPWPSVVMLWGGQAPWLLAIASAWQRRRWKQAPALAEPGELHLWTAAWIFPLLLLAIIRLMTTGIRFGP